MRSPTGSSSGSSRSRSSRSGGLGIASTAESSCAAGVVGEVGGGGPGVRFGRERCRQFRTLVCPRASGFRSCSMRHAQRLTADRRAPARLDRPARGARRGRRSRLSVRLLRNASCAMLGVSVLAAAARRNLRAARRSWRRWPPRCRTPPCWLAAFEAASARDATAAAPSLPGAVLFGVGIEALHLVTVYFIAPFASGKQGTYGSLGAGCSTAARALPAQPPGRLRRRSSTPRSGRGARSLIEGSGFTGTGKPSRCRSKRPPCVQPGRHDVLRRVGEVGRVVRELLAHQLSRGRGLTARVPGRPRRRTGRRSSWRAPRSTGRSVPGPRVRAPRSRAPSPGRVARPGVADEDDVAGGGILGA